MNHTYFPLVSKQSEKQESEKGRLDYNVFSPLRSRYTDRWPMLRLPEHLDEGFSAATTANVLHLSGQLPCRTVRH